MSNLYEDYKKRVQFKGKNKREYVKTKVKESIESLINDSQYGFTIEVNNKPCEVAILSTKTTQEYEAANVIAPLEIGLDKGVVFNWDNNDWIILKKMFRPDQPGFNGIAYRCTGYLKWIDEETKQLHIQPAYIRSGRITNALGVTPDKNQVYDNIIMHDTDWNMMAATQQNLAFHPEMRFIIKGQAYRVTNVDNVSIDNVSILSFVDDRLLDTDDTENMIAYSNVYDYTIQCNIKDEIKMYVDDILELPITILNNGIQVDEDYILESLDSNLVEVSGNRIIGKGLGKALVKCSLKKNNTVYIIIPIELIENHITQEIEAYIEGNDYIEWNSTEIYKLSNGESGTFDVEVKSKIRKEIEFIKNENGQTVGVSISIKDKYSGTIVIECSTNGKVIEKTVYMRSVQEEIMILNKSMEETDSFLDINNDIYRIITVLNECQELKKLLVYTDMKPLERKEQVDKDLRDNQISRVPVLPYNEDEGSLIVVSFISGDMDQKTNAIDGSIAIDIFTPGNQWIINEGIRPLMIGHTINNLMRKELKQTGGIKYRLSTIVNAQLSDILLGYRLIYDIVIND